MGPGNNIHALALTGGHLLIETRHSGFTGTSRSIDAVSTSGSGYGTLFSACWASGISANSGSQGNFTIVRISATDTTAVSVGGGSLETPAKFELAQNYPNPFNPSTHLHFSLVSSQLTILKVYDVLGREVATLVNEMKEPGVHTVQWDASGMASGIYVYRLQSGSFVETKKMMLMR